MALNKAGLQDEDPQRIARTKRAEISGEEALRRMDEFAEQRKEKLIATVRKGKC